MNKKYQDKKELREKIVSGVLKLTNNVKTTMGPRGRNVILQEHGKSPIITKDGVTVAKFIQFDDPFENAAADIIKQAADQTNKMAGDGTTTATVLANAILVEAQKHIAANISPIDLKRGIDKACDFIVDKLRECAKPIQNEEEIERVATISANGDEMIGKIISKAVNLVGKDGAIVVKEGKGLKTSLELTEGFRFDAGFASAQFITNERKGTMNYRDPLFLITDIRIDNVKELIPALGLAARIEKPLIIVAEEIEGQALAALIYNSLRGTMPVAAIIAPKFGEERKEFLKDLSLAVGATFITRMDDLNLSKVQLSHFGKAQSIDSTKTHTIIMGGEGKKDLIKDKIEILKEQIVNSDDMKNCEKLNERISRLVGGIATITVGANTEVEMIEKKHRIDDALEAVKSAISEGIIPGGGATLARISHEAKGCVDVDFPPHRYGVEILLKACSAPMRVIIDNCGLSSDVILSKILDSSKESCYDAVNEKFINAFEAGIVDPVKVTRLALQNAVSAAGILITTDHAIIEVKNGN